MNYPEKYTCEKMTNHKVQLVTLTLENADFLYSIYTNTALTMNFDDPFLKNETPLAFTKRIISTCECIFTIRPSEKPNLMIGDCALHHWNRHNKEIFIGGSLFPMYWGQGYMQAAFELLIKIAKQHFDVATISGQTKITNTKAIRLAEKMGFVRYGVDGQEIILKKEI